MQHPDFAGFMKNSIREVTPEDNVEFWADLGDGNYGDGTRFSSTRLRDPRMRCICAMLVLGLTCRKSGLEKVHSQELFLLGSIVARRNVNVPYFVAKYLANMMKGAKSGRAIFGGQFVTLLGRYFGLDGQDGFDGCTELLSGMLFYREPWFLGSHLIERYTLHGADDFTWCATIPLAGLHHAEEEPQPQQPEPQEQPPPAQPHMGAPVEPWAAVMDSLAGLHVGMGDIRSTLDGHITQYQSESASMFSRLDDIENAVADVRYEQDRRRDYEDSLHEAYHRHHGMPYEPYQPYTDQYYQPSYHSRYYQSDHQHGSGPTPMDQDLHTSSSYVPVHQPSSSWPLIYQSPQEREYQQQQEEDARDRAEQERQRSSWIWRPWG